MRVALVIPAYNEGKIIKKVVRDLAKVFNKTTYDFQIIVVDDGSKDDTAVQARKAGAHVISHIINIGCGGATATGLSYAQQQDFDIATTSDADGQHDPRDVLTGVELVAKNQADLLIGSRFVDSQGMSRVKMLGNSGLSLITNVLFGIKITDSQSGLRVFSKYSLTQLKWKTSGYEFCSEMLWRAKQLKLRVDEFPIKSIYTEYSKAKGQNNWNGVNIVKALVWQRAVEMFRVRYVLLVLLNIPVILLALINIVTQYKVHRIGTSRLRQQLVLWLAILFIVTGAFPIYNHLIGRPLLDSKSFSSFDITQTTVLVYLIYNMNTLRRKIEQNERLIRDLHQELAIKMSGSTGSNGKS